MTHTKDQTDGVHLSRRAVIGSLLAVPTIAIGGRSRAATPPDLSVFGALPHIQSATLSPDGSRIAYGTVKDGKKLICDYDRQTGKVATAELMGPVLRDLMWVDNVSLLAVSTKVFGMREFAGGKNEYLQAVIMNIPARRFFQLYNNIDLFQPVVMGDLNRVMIKGESRITASNIKLTFDSVSCLYDFSTRNGQGYSLDETEFRVINWVVTPEGVPLGRAERNPKTGVWSLKYKSASGWRTIFTQLAETDAPTLEGLGRDGQSLLIYMPAGEQAGHFIEIDSNGQSSAPLNVDGVAVSPIFHPASRALAGFVNSTPSKITYQFYDLAMQQISDKISRAFHSAYFARLSAFADDPHKLIVYTEGPGDAGTYYYIDAATGHSEIIDNTYPELPANLINLKHSLRFKASDGLELEAFVTMPSIPGSTPQPSNLACIVLPHGGPQSCDDMSFDWMAQALATQGYVVLQVNFRGSEGYGLDFVKAGYGEWGRKMQTDLSDGVQELVRQRLVDPKRVAIAGASYGGYAALSGVALESNIYNCAVAIAPVTDLKAFVEWSRIEAGGDPDDLRVAYWKRFMGDENTWDAVSPAKRATEINTPVLLIHGKDDDTVPIEQSQRVYGALQKAGKPVEFILLKEEDHYLSKEPTRIQTLKAMVDFLLKHNPPGPV